MKSWGYGAEIAARIGEELFHDLDAPVRRVAAMDTFVAYQPLLEDAILPQPEELYRAMEELAAFLGVDATSYHPIEAIRWLLCATIPQALAARGVLKLCRSYAATQSKVCQGVLLRLC